MDEGQDGHPALSENAAARIEALERESKSLLSEKENAERLLMEAQQEAEQLKREQERIKLEKELDKAK